MAEKDRLLARYNKLVGDALELGIKTYLPGTGKPGDLGPWAKSMGELEDEVRAARGQGRSLESHLLEAYLKADELGTR